MYILNKSEAIMKTLFITSVLVLSLFFIGCGVEEEGEKADTSTPPSSDTTTNGKNSIMLYVAGSDLEEDVKAASIDFNEILVGYNKLSSSEQNNLDIAIAFGGSRATGWTGIKYADIDCLAQDNKDGVYGNDTCYSYENINANMGDESTLKDFLNAASSMLANSKRSYLIFWNHGGAYKGICNDTNHKGDGLEIQELNNAMRDTNTKVDVIGMDACLMASIEAIRGVKDYADYYLASEETEPGHGWDYESVIPIIGKGTNQPLRTVGSDLVDSYIDSPKHNTGQVLTLSFLDLSQTENVVNKIDLLSRSLDADSDFRTIGLSAYEAQKFAIVNDDVDGWSIGLKSFSQNIGYMKSSIKEVSDELNRAIDSLVVYTRGKDAQADGITIYQPLYSKYWLRYSSISYTASPSWENLLSNFTVTKGADKQDPAINSEESCTNKSQDGFCLNITDNVALKSVESYGLLPLGDNTILLYTEILPSSGDTYFLPKFNDKWFYLCDGNSDTQCMFPSAFEIETPDTDTKIYVSMGQYNGKDATFIIKVKNDVVSMSAILDSDSDFSSKQQYMVKQGDSVRFDYIVVTSKGNVITSEGSSLTFSNTPTWSKIDLDANIEYYAAADDFNDHTTYSDSHFLEDTGGGTVPTLNIDTTSSQSRLSYLEGKTATFNYDYYGVAYNETIIFNTAAQYNSGLERYVITGARNQDTVYCFSDEEESDHIIINNVVYMYDCVSNFEGGAKDLFTFNINSNKTLSGYYEYIKSEDSSLNLYAEVKNPDSVLVSSSIE